MEHSEIQKEATRLGKLFIKELGLEQTSDTISRWMAFYLAEKISLCEKLQGLEKAKAEKECFEIILNLWKRRWTLPSNKRPLEEFAPILNFLQALNPEKENPHYYPQIPIKIKKSKKDTKDPVQTWLNVAANIDRTCRIFLYDVFQFAAECASDKDTKQWLKSSLHLPNRQDFETIRIVLKYQDEEEDEEKQNEELRKHNEENIKKKIDTLEQFAKFNLFLLEKYKVELSSFSEK
ncbi:MAG: hypothetical protein JNK00_13115 [Flavipsychrobacter sp.]|nr:hypothetical protein [Flavipsychrobacter sp.]